jgi:hypothetical protein
MPSAKSHISLRLQILQFEKYCLKAITMSNLDHIHYFHQNKIKEVTANHEKGHK